MDPLSPEAEIVRVRDHLHDLNEKVGMIAVAHANVAGDVKAMTAKFDSVVESTDTMKRSIGDLLKSFAPLAEQVSTLRIVVYGAVGMVLVTVFGAMLAGIVRAAQ